MYSLSALCKLKDWEFEYQVDHIPDYLRDNPQGNYKRALENGMKIYQNSLECSEDYGSEVLNIQEGGRQKEAEYGINILVDEIKLWKEFKGIKDLDIFLPSGTGTTALYLQKNYLGKVYTTPCVGDEEYLKKQFLMLEKNQLLHPTILNTVKKYHFGKLYRDFYIIWLNLEEQTKVEFDLLYDPKGWMIVLDNIDIFTKPMLYIHQGGLIGNESMLPRYRRKYKSS